MVATAAQLTDEQQQLTYLHDIFAKQKSAYLDAPYPSAKQRQQDLDKLADALREFKEELCQAVNKDFSCRAEGETMIAEIMVSLEGIKYNRKHLKKWMKPSKRHVNPLFAPASNKVVFQPKGVVGIMVPWNYPVQLAVAPLAAALAAGNRAVIKMSEFTPYTNEVLYRMLAKYFPEEQVAVMSGEAAVGAEFSSMHWDHLLFTGSTAVARHVMSACGKNLVPVTLELGGKSPCIVTQKGDIKAAAKSIIFGKATNAGQTCIAPDYILCPQDLIPELKAEIADYYKQCYPTLKNNPDYTAIVNERQFHRLTSVLKDAEDKGAQVQPLNHANEDFSGTRKIPLTLVENTRSDMSIMEDEIFGPLLPILPYSDLNEVVSFINKGPRPLALYLFSHDKREQDFILENTHAGGVTINDCLTHIAQDDMPFGGVGDSGIGAYHGKEGFLSLSHAKSVHKKGRINLGSLVHAPYGRTMHKLIYKFMIR
ncbi:coniferyl aldehyde dehydrogenase [Bermanella marisrubri]|uniref:Aldehyde dehydrogenase n=1 Tax=Bermanella marisrubri TaxID=207949 RepID=Q1N468_9GAMM|nr:coniferyl aldehyde dehydrogenase [Bermanella marisrubri]EAT12997.1 NAD-dependent aldehyde dehydrogenase [Oceanobacter sp. RED65] [Bermanella marisrubri]QIZ82876.1 coniferyl aldehyde dehydrogenase [Bermanella marisrubri]